MNEKLLLTEINSIYKDYPKENNLSSQNMSKILFISKWLNETENRKNDYYSPIEKSFAETVNKIALKTNFKKEKMQDCIFLLELKPDLFNKKYLFGNINLNHVLSTWLNEDFFCNKKRSIILENCFYALLNHKKEYHEYYKDTADLIYEFSVSKFPEIVKIIDTLSLSDLVLLVSVKFIHSDAITDYSDSNFDYLRELNFYVYNKIFEFFYTNENCDDFFSEKEKIFDIIRKDFYVFDSKNYISFRKEFEQEVNYSHL